MTRYMLVPENFDLKEVKEINLPNNIYTINPANHQGIHDTIKQESHHEITKTTPSDNKIVHKQDVTPLKGKYLAPEIIKYTSDQSNAKKVLQFLKEKQFKQNKHGRLILKNKVHPILLESCFLHLVNDARKTKADELFYKLLKENGLDKAWLPKSKKKYF